MEQTRTILVVDDDPTVYDAISSYLSGDEYRILTASRWTEAIATLQEDPPDAVLLDLHLPTVQGDALLEFIRESDRHLPVVILSSKNNPADITRLGELGASGFIRKPFETEDLVVVLKQIMADLDPVSADASQPDEFEDDETNTTKDSLSSDISPGAGVHDLKRQPTISPLESTTPPRKRRTRKKHGQGRGRSVWGTRLRKLRNFALVIVFFILIGFLVYLMREGLGAGFLGITIN